MGEIVEDYDTDKLFPVYGFGARLPPHGNVSHMFPVNFNAQNPFVERVSGMGCDKGCIRPALRLHICLLWRRALLIFNEIVNENFKICIPISGILNCYKSAISRVQLYGPTNFAPIIRETARMASSRENMAKRVPDFFILLIITDGVITDMEATKQAIIQNSNLPFSIIIVGVGGADFEAMEELDSDDKLLEYQVRNDYANYWNKFAGAKKMEFVQLWVHAKMCNFL